jgi:WD40 repeat protein
MCYSSVGWGQPNAIVVSGGCDKVVMVWDVKTGCVIFFHSYSLQPSRSYIALQPSFNLSRSLARSPSNAR